MKLLGRTDGKNVVASMGHHDYISVSSGEDDHIMMDGGQPHTNHYAGYNKFWGTPIYFEVPQTFGELYTDYQCNFKNRKYGVWKVEDVRVLDPNEIPDFESFDLLVANSVWGTRGINGDESLKYVNFVDCSTDHLLSILNSQRVGDQTTKIIHHIINERTN